MSQLIVDDDVVLAGCMPFESALAPLDDTAKCAHRHDALDVRAPVEDARNAAVDLDDWRLVDERRKPCFNSHTRLLQNPSRVVGASITFVKFKTNLALSTSGLAAFRSAWLISTDSTALPRARRAGALPRVSPSFRSAISPMASPLIHNAPEHLPSYCEDRHV